MDVFLKVILESLLSFTREHLQRARQTASVGANTVEYILIVLGTENVCRWFVILLRCLSALRCGFRFTSCLHLSIGCSSAALFLVCDL